MRSLIRSLQLTLWVARLVFRFFSGRPMSGQRKTDATFWRPARHSLDPSGTALRWEMMRGAARAAWRVGALYLVLLSFSLPLIYLMEKVVSLPWYLSFSFLLWSHLLLLGSSFSSYFLRRLIKERGYYLPFLEEKEEGGRRLRLQKIEGVRDWRREKVLPVAKAVSVIVNQHIPERKAHEWVIIPANYREPRGKSVEIRLPAHFTGADEGVKKRLVSSVSHKLGVPSMLPNWEIGGSSPRLLLSSPPTPPKELFYADVEKYLLASEEYRPFLGITGEEIPFLAEMIDDSPHIALSAGPGAGKSTKAKLIIAQALRWGWGVVVLDWKQTEAYSWLGGLEGVIYLSEIEAIHDMGERIAQEVDIRKRNGMAGRAKVLIVRDEWNITAELLMAYWTDLRSTADPEEKRTMPVKSPALRGYGVLDYAGREYGLFDLCIAQRFSARVFNGNSDIRECFNIKCMSRYSPQTQKMLAPDIKPFPKKSNIQGRWTEVVGDEATVIQSPFLTNEEARAYAMGGKPNPVSPFSSAGVTERANMRTTQQDRLGLDSTGPSGVSSSVNLQDKPRKLSDMTDELGVTLDVLRNAVKRDPQFPLPVGGTPNNGYTYLPSQVRDWYRKREATKVAERLK